MQDNYCPTFVDFHVNSHWEIAINNLHPNLMAQVITHQNK